LALQTKNRQVPTVLIGPIKKFVLVCQWIGQLNGVVRYQRKYRSAQHRQFLNGAGNFVLRIPGQIGDPKEVL